MKLHCDYCASLQDSCDHHADIFEGSNHKKGMNSSGTEFLSRDKCREQLLWAQRMNTSGSSLYVHLASHIDMKDVH
jgi:hypothetical protein